ncbi:MAG: sugar transferase, partial [Oscillospiraceae bacterium]|nr:sugar transferase [Oscillospiraceae bacterium]
MLSYVLKRILSLIPTLLVVSVVVFLVVYMIPGGPATAILGMEATPEALAQLNAELGFDRPFLVQYGDWFVNVLQGDWGQSYFLQMSVTDAIAEYFFPTLSLAIYAELISLILAIPMGIIAILVKADLPGPVFFRQEHLGLNGKPITATKIRSMREDAEAMGAK